ncbi:MAG: M23 family metallopeptidase, partial [Fibrobacter sp.]|nr:M23 family metallopeptidase [Fibrobacter sp.]
YKKYYPKLKSPQLQPVNYNINYGYNLPYKKGQYYKVIQGYDGTYSHAGKNAIDFEMPEGTEIYAIREGFVFQVVDHNSRGCASEDCLRVAHVLRIRHPDGVLASYSHIRKNGAVVKKGDYVKKGDLIGYSGNTGWSTVPHLHLECYIPSDKGWKSIKTLFRRHYPTKCVS